jgi:hypothetical protein
MHVRMHVCMHVRMHVCMHVRARTCGMALAVARTLCVGAFGMCELTPCSRS